MSIALTYTFTSGTRILASQVNSNFNTLATSAVDKGGDTITGNLGISGNLTVTGTLTQTGVATFTAAPIFTAATASRLLATDASKGLVSTITSANLASSISDKTGSGAAVFATTPTLVTPILGAATGTTLVLTGALTAGLAIIPPSTTASTIAAAMSVASATGVTLADDATTTMALNTGLIIIYDATNGEGAIFRFFNNNTAIINQSGANLWVTTNTDGKNSLEGSASTVTLRNRSGAPATYRLFPIVLA